MIARTPPHIATLALAAAIAPLAMNVYLPSLAAIAEHFNTTAPTAQLSVSLFLAATAVMQIVCGPLSDQHGRRPVMLALLSIMLGATLVCIYAPTIEIFLAGRILQASAAVGIVLSRAIVRDIISGDGAASMIGYVTMGMTLAPMIGPALGGILATNFGWQASFWLIFGFTAFAMVVMWFDLGETNKNRGGSFRQTFQSWPELVGSHRFWGYALCCAFASGAFFAFLGAAPLIGIQYYGMSPTAFGFYFFFIAIGYMSGNFFAGRYSTKVGMNAMMMIGNLVVTAGILLAVAMVLIWPENPLAFFAPIFFMGLGNGITLPNANAGIVNVRPKIAGAASGLGGSLQIGGGAMFAALTGYGLSPQDGPFFLLVVMLVSITLAIGAAAYVLYIAREREKEASAV